MIAAPAQSESEPSPLSSPFERIANNRFNTGTVQDEPDSPSGRNNIDEPASYRYIVRRIVLNMMTTGNRCIGFIPSTSLRMVVLSQSERWPGYVYVVMNRELH